MTIDDDDNNDNTPIGVPKNGHSVMSVVQICLPHIMQA